MVVLPHELLLAIISLDCFFLVSIIDSMASQNLENWEFSLAHLPDVLFQPSQPSISRRRMQDEGETSKRRVQPNLDLDPQRLLLTSLKSL
jgi:hypothetical protein